MSAVKSVHEIAAPRTDYAARLTFDFRCPHCGREVRARDVEIGQGDVSAICCGCDHTLLTIEYLQKQNETSEQACTTEGA